MEQQMKQEKERITAQVSQLLSFKLTVHVYTFAIITSPLTHLQNCINNVKLCPCGKYFG